MNALSMPAGGCISDGRLQPLWEKMEGGARLSFEDGLLLYESHDLTGIAAMAHHARCQRHGLDTYYVVSRRLSYTNVCITDCRFCAFHAHPGDPDAYTLSVDGVIRELEKEENCGVRELHMTAGHNPALDIGYFEALFRSIKARFPNIHLKVFTMVEIDYYAKVSGISVEAFLDRCIAAGLESCPGGGAEIFDIEIRQALCPDKSDAKTWLSVAELCHRKGLPTNATMLYGHIEKPCHKVDHLLKLRELQDRTGGFLAFIPLAYQPGDNPLGRSQSLGGSTACQDLREIAVSRLLLDNIPHIKAYWVMITEGVAQAALSYGANDMDGTVIDEEIAHRAGASTPKGLGRAHLERLIRDAGFTPVERDNLYQTFCESRF